MSKETKKNVEVTEEKKVVTKYDQKMQRRKEEERKEARTRKIAKISAIAILAAIVISIVAAVAINLDRIHREYIKVDGKSISQIEFDMYYSLTKNGIVSQTLYGDMTYLDYFASYFGYDVTKTDRSQIYEADHNLTWYDYFAEATLDTIKEYKALLKIADEKGFEHTDADADYNEFIDEMKKSADESGVSLGRHYKDVFGSYATQSNMENYIRDYLKAVAYEESLYEQEKATDDEVKKYYEEHKDDYDTVEYHSVYIRAEEKDSETSLAEAKKKAEEFMNDVVSVETFVDMCVDYVASSDVETYKKEDSTLMTGIYKSSLSTKESEWLFNAERKAGDKTIIDDSENNQYQVIYFVEREYDVDNNEAIRSTLYAEAYEKIVKPYIDAMEVDNKYNRIKMLDHAH